MKNPAKTAQTLDLPYSPEADAFLDELERSGQFRVGIEAEADDGATPAASNEYTWGRGSGSVSIQDWWTAGGVVVRVGAGIAPADLAFARLGDSLVLRTQDALDRVVLEGYLGLIPDASTLRVLFGDGTEWTGADIVERLSLHVVRAAEPPPGS